jgi:hypothetical protein
MADRNRLFLHEELLLLGLKDDKGTFASGTNMTYGLGGALLAELLLERKIKVVTPKKTPLAEGLSYSRSGDPVIDECLQKIRDARKRASLQTWVSRFVGIKRLKPRIAEGLVKRGILRVEEDKILGIFSRTMYPESDPGPERAIIERLRHAIFGNATDIDSRTVALVALAHHSSVLKVVFDKKKLKERKTRIERIMNGDLSGKATAQAIQAMEAVQTAVMVAVILPTIITSSVVHH